MKQPGLWKLPPIKSDVVYTPEPVVLDMLEWVKPSGLCLDPCKGDGAFIKHLPPGSDWCEIQEGKDFFDYHRKVDWIIGNPPYSIFEDFLAHSLELSDNVVYILPTNKVFQRAVIMRMINKWGGVRGMRVYGSGSVVGFPFGFSVAAFWLQKNYTGLCELLLVPPNNGLEPTEQAGLIKQSLESAAQAD